MSSSEIVTLYLSTLVALSGLAGYFINHLLRQIEKLETRVDEIYNILLTK